MVFDEQLSSAQIWALCTHSPAVDPEEIIDTIIDAGAKSPQQILDALRDGQALAALEITDSDQQAVEDAYAMINSLTRAPTPG
ncbi:MAG: hypothetical protein WCY71_12155 [Halothiobacillaceae bacterium]